MASYSCLQAGHASFDRACYATCLPPQLADKQQDLVRVQRSASFNSINIQASASVHSHVLCEDESPLAAALPDTAPLKGGDGYDRLLEYRCGRYLFHHGQGTFLPVPPLPADFPTGLAAVAGSRNIKGARCVALFAWLCLLLPAAVDGWLVVEAPAEAAC